VKKVEVECGGESSGKRDKQIIMLALREEWRDSEAGSREDNTEPTGSVGWDRTEHLCCC